MLSLSKTHLLVPDFIAQPVNGLLDAYRAFQRCEMPCEVTPMQVGHRAAVFALHACFVSNASHACLLSKASDACQHGECQDLQTSPAVIASENLRFNQTLQY